MPTFTTKSHLPPSQFKSLVRRYPFLTFGLPFLSITVVASFMLSQMTRTKFDYQDTRVRSLTKSEELGMSGGRKRVDLREEYYRLNNPQHAEPALDALRNSSSSSSSPSPSSPESASRRTPKPPRKNIFEFVPQDELENVRVPRPEGVPEWGGGGVREEEMAPVVGRRKGDRLV